MTSSLKKPEPKIIVVAAMAENFVIGRNGDIPWHVKADYAFWNEKSRGKPVIMGRKTFETMPPAFKKREKICVITRNKNWTHDNVHVVHTLKDALMHCKALCTKTGDTEIIIGGGGEIYTQALPHTDEVYLSIINTTVTDGDAFFPYIDPREWQHASTPIEYSVTLGDSSDFTLYHYKKKKLEAGNALFLILITIALFAALTFSFTQSSQTTINKDDREEAVLNATQLIQYGQDIAQTIQRMKRFRSVKDHELDFSSTERLNASGAIAILSNDNCSSNHCQIFHADGGGVPYQSFEYIRAPELTGYTSTNERPGHSMPIINKVEGLGTNLPEIILRYRGIDPATCREVNARAGLPEDPSFSANSLPTFVVSGADTKTNLANTTGVATFGDIHPDLQEAPYFCLKNNSTFSAAFYYVVLIR